MGGAGLYSLSQIVLFEVGPSDKPSLMGALVGITLAVSYVLGPILGAVISSTTDWGVIFWIKYLPVIPIPNAEICADMYIQQRPGRRSRSRRSVLGMATSIGNSAAERLELNPQDRLCGQFCSHGGICTARLRPPRGRRLHVCLGQSGHRCNSINCSTRLGTLLHMGGLSRTEEIHTHRTYYATEAILSTCLC